jgi:hypothetical protein
VNDPRDCTKPLAVDLKVVDVSTGAEAARTNSDSQGHFQVDLPPGNYTITALDSSGFATPVEVTVRSRRFTETDVAVDSGVR